ncbi:MAG: TPM domain-containing protein [Flavobacteriales bacterium]|jgi:uncharacterized membrane protein|nr:TPM domain-containing protein [Flavobacteriales bacterium]
MNARDYFSLEQQERIKDAIGDAERETSGEIRVHIENECKEDVLDRAAFWFEKLEMHKTALRNGVLIYLALNDHKFAILGDAGINAKVPPGFWDSTRDKMLGLFRTRQYTEGLCAGIQEAGLQLKTYFPWQEDDINELSDEISFN